MPKSSAHPQPSQLVRPEPTPGPIPRQMEQMAQMLATTLQQPRESEISIKRARKLGAKPYDGSGDPERALSWVEANEEIFQMIGCTEEQKVSYSAFLLKDRAKDWWKAHQRAHPEGVIWAEFKREFTERFFPKSYKDAKVEEFYRLEQGSSTVPEYKKKFSELIRLVPFFAKNEQEKINRFMAGLNPAVRTIVASASHTRYGQLVEAATRVEQSAQTALKSKSQFSQKRSWTGSHQGEASKMPKSGQRPAWSQSRQQSQRPQASQSSIRSSAGSRSQQSWRSRPVCSRCGRSHSGECLQGRTGCFRCGQEGHFMRDCPSAVASSPLEAISTAQGHTSGSRGPDRGGPQTGGATSAWQPSGGTGRGMPPRGQPSRPSRALIGRPRSQAAIVYMVTQQAADATPDVVTGTISLFDTDAHVLVDSGATHSFISREFIERVGIEMRPTECSMVVSLPTGDSLIANRVYRGSKVTIASHEFESDLIVLDIHDFDIILVMDWLAKHRATVDCYRKEVQFSQLGEPEVIFCGERKILSTSLISVIQANKMLRKACQAYLVYAIESGNNEMQLAEVPVVNEFFNVFPEDLPGLPPDREIEFEIELAPGTEPISIAPYRMAPAELK